MYSALTKISTNDVKGGERGKKRGAGRERTTAKRRVSGRTRERRKERKRD